MDPTSHNYSYLPTCVKQKAGQTSIESGTLGLKVGHSYRFDINNRLKMVKFSNKLVPKNSIKNNEGRVKKKWDSSKFWTKNWDCPSKRGSWRV